MLNYSYLIQMTRKPGILQFSHHDKPDKTSGYTLDDNARAAILTLLMPTSYRRQLLPCYADFMRKATENHFVWHNFMNADGAFPKDEQASSDSRGRAFLSFCLVNNQNPALDTPALLEQLLQGVFPIWETSSLRARSYILLAINSIEPELIREHPVERLLNGIRNEIISSLLDAYDASHSLRWHWYENKLTYCNGILPHALLTCPHTPENRAIFTIARDSLLFLCDTLFRTGYLNIIGNHGWWEKGKQTPALFDQQPVDAASIALACLAAYECFEEPSWLELAQKARDWFSGDNIHCLPLIDPKSGGCFDALTKTGVNENQGAESLLSYLLTFHAVGKYSLKEVPSSSAAATV